MQKCWRFSQHVAAVTGLWTWLCCSVSSTAAAATCHVLCCLLSQTLVDALCLLSRHGCSYDCLMMTNTVLRLAKLCKIPSLAVCARGLRCMPCIVVLPATQSSRCIATALICYLYAAVCSTLCYSQSLLHLRCSGATMCWSAGTFSGKTARILENADISNFDGVLRTIDVEVKPQKVSASGDVTEAVVKPVSIGIGKCAVTEDGVPMKVNSMLKVHLLAELQVCVHGCAAPARAAPAQEPPPG